MDKKFFYKHYSYAQVENLSFFIASKRIKKTKYQAIYQWHKKVIQHNIVWPDVDHR